MKFFEAPTWWKLKEAEAHAKSVGLATEWKGDTLFIEERFEKIGVTINDEKVFQGYQQMMKSWNGWQTPMFEKEEAQSVMDDFNSQGAGDHLEWDGDNIKLIVVGEDDEPIDEIVIIPEQIEFEGKTVTVYDLSLGWVWDKA